MPEDGIEQLRAFDAILLGAVGWPARVPRFRLAARAPAAHPQGVRPVCERPAAPLAAWHDWPPPGREVRYPVHPREHGGRIQRRRRPRAPGHAGRGRCGDLDLHAARRRTHPALRLRAGARPPQKARVRHEVQRAEALDGVLGRGDRGRCCGLPGRRGDALPHRRHGRPLRDAARSRSTSWSRPTCSETSSPTSGRRSRAALGSRPPPT